MIKLYSFFQAKFITAGIVNWIVMIIQLYVLFTILLGIPLIILIKNNIMIDILLSLKTVKMESIEIIQNMSNKTIFKSFLIDTIIKCIIVFVLMKFEKKLENFEKYIKNKLKKNK